MFKVVFGGWCGGGAGSGGSGGGAGAGGAGPSVGGPCSLAPRRLYRLTPAQIRRSWEALLGAGSVDPGLDARLIPFLPRPAPYSNAEAVLSVSSAFLQEVFDSAKTSVDKALMARKNIAPCLEAQVTRSCVAELMPTFLAKAWRRPVGKADIDTQLATFDEFAAKVPADRALAYTLRAILTAPDLLFRSELGEKQSDGRYALTPTELATELAYALTDAPPDAMLWADATAGKLDKTKLMAHAKRLLASPTSGTALMGFFTDYLHVAPAPIAAQKEEMRRTVEDMLWQGSGTIEQLFTNNKVFVNDELAKLYWDQTTNAGWRAVEPPEGRSGLLTLGAFLSVERNRSARGKLIRERFLCEEPLAVPANVNTDIASRRAELEAQAGRPLNEEELRERHMSDPGCAACHRLIDPIGQPLHVFDDNGTYRTKTASGLPIDTKGELIETQGSDGPVADFKDLGRRLAGAAQARTCFVTQVVQFAYGRAVEDAMTCDPWSLAPGFDAKTGSVRDLVVAIAGSDRFRLRRAP